MCGLRAEPRPQTVFIDTGSAALTGVTPEDAVAAMEDWNRLFRAYHGFDIFVPFSGSWLEADVLITAAGWPKTWVHTACAPGFAQRGNNVAVVFIGADDAVRNKAWLTHELGHVLGFPDYIAPQQGVDRSGYVNARTCSLSGVPEYFGIMSYCASPTTGLKCLGVPSIEDDCTLVQHYWN